MESDWLRFRSPRRPAPRCWPLRGANLSETICEPQGVAHVFDSRSLSFVDDVRRVTQGLGVDVVLNSLSGPAIPAGLSLLRAGGRFVEIGKRDIQTNAGLGLRPFQDNLAFFALDLDRLLAQRPGLARGMIEQVLQQFALNKLAPIPVRTFPVSRAADALRYMAEARQIGKVVLDMRDPVARSMVKQVPSTRPLQFPADGTYLVTGGFTGFGLATAKWLVAHGVRHLALVSRSGANSLEAQQQVLELESAGARVLPLAADVSDERQLSQALDTIRNELCPLKGVFHAAMVLDDAIALQLTPERMEKVLAPKAWGAWNLHRLTGDDPLEHFVLYSSATTVFGNPSQANYVAACTFLDQLALHRRSRGAAGTVSGLGSHISDVGVSVAKPGCPRAHRKPARIPPRPRRENVGFHRAVAPRQHDSGDAGRGALVAVFAVPICHRGHTADTAYRSWNNWSATRHSRPWRPVIGASCCLRRHKSSGAVCFASSWSKRWPVFWGRLPIRSTSDVRCC